jgi:Protein of unknown function (DUF1570)
MKIKVVVSLAAALVTVAIIVGLLFTERVADRPAKPLTAEQPAIPADARRYESAHYQIHSTANAEQTARMTQAVEHLYAAYATIFPSTTAEHKLNLVLYRDRDEFKRHNRSAPWAEGYYLKPRSHAYYAADARNPYHWMLHEVTHQLSREVSGLRPNRWIDEGLATYFSTSRLDTSGLHLGDVDPYTYPIWWLKRHSFSGDRTSDLANGDFISVEQMLTGRNAPDVDTHFNQYYLCAWSLTHFLFHYDNGRYADAHRQLIARGGSAADFVALIGPLQKIEDEWYPYLVEQARALERR